MAAHTFAEDKSLYHFQIKQEPEGPVPLGFPFGLQGGQSKEDVTRTLNEVPLYRGDFDTRYTEWSIGKRIRHKRFHPSLITLAYKHDKLMQVTFVQTDAPDCSESIGAMEDAVDYIKTHYIFPAASIVPGPKFGSNNCVFYMKPGQAGWQAGEGDYLINVDTNWRDMKYSGYVTITYMPLYNEPDIPSLP